VRCGRDARFPLLAVAPWFGFRDEVMTGETPGGEDEAVT
jgi:hypothetical protein